MLGNLMGDMEEEDQDQDSVKEVNFCKKKLNFFRFRFLFVICVLQSQVDWVATFLQDLASFSLHVYWKVENKKDKKTKR